jgi:hypothetical protein
VARSTIYKIFGSRQGLMVVALAEDLLRRVGFDQLGRAAVEMWVVTSLATFTHLYRERGLSVEETGDRLIAIATRSICQE